MVEGLAARFAGLVDPRETRRCDHQLIDILAIAVGAVIACAASWEDIELYGRSKQAWLKTFLALPNGIPSYDTFRRVFMLLDPDAFEAVREHFERTGFGCGSGGRPVFDAFDESHGRLVRRRVFVSSAARELEPLSGWPDLRTVLAVEAIRGLTGAGKIEAEVRSFLGSCGDDPAVLVPAIRRHWAVENALHWVLDITFREDDSRVRDHTAARNLALLRKVALNLVGRDRTSKASVRARWKKAAWNDRYMLQLLAD